MSAIQYIENGLNVQYFSSFLNKVKADAFFIELKKLAFYTPSFKIYNRTVHPKRQIIAFGDANVSHSFSGTSVPALPWTPLMLELRDAVEKELGCTFNYVLVNAYADGNCYISHHKDNETCLESTFPIPVLSFGEQRTITFKKPNCKSTTISLEHGSMYVMHKPTNEHFTHGISPDPSAKGMRISLTFRHILTCEPDPPCKKLKIDDELPHNDWLTKMYKEVDPIIAQWNLNWNTFSQVHLENNNLRLHIRQFNENAHGQHFPTKNGIVMTCATWNDFKTKIKTFYFRNASESFISNNQLLTAFVDDTYCIFQQIFNTKVSGYFFKPAFLKLSKDQILKIIELIPDISNSLIETKLTNVLPNIILNKSDTCFNHFNLQEEAKKFFFTCIESEIHSCLNNVFHCEGCVMDHPAQHKHDCLTFTDKEKFNMMRDAVLLNFNVYSIVKNLFERCSCHYTESFLKEFNMDYYDSYFENMFLK